MLRKLWACRSDWMGASLGISHAVVFAVLILSQEPNPPGLEQGVSDPLPAGHTMLAGQEFHWSDESAALKTLALLDLVGVLIGAIISIPLMVVLLISPSLEAKSYYDFVMCLSWGSAQWWVIGAYLHNVITPNRDGSTQQTARR